jgi:hypothetical protein
MARGADDGQAGLRRLFNGQRIGAMVRFDPPGRIV